MQIYPHETLHQLEKWAGLSSTQCCKELTKFAHPTLPIESHSTLSLPLIPISFIRHYSNPISSDLDRGSSKLSKPLRQNFIRADTKDINRIEVDISTRPHELIQTCAQFFSLPTPWYHSHCLSTNLPGIHLYTTIPSKPIALTRSILINLPIRETPSPLPFLSVRSLPPPPEPPPFFSFTSRLDFVLANMYFFSL